MTEFVLVPWAVDGQKEKIMKAKNNFLNNKWVIVFLLLPFFEPSGIEEMAVYIGGIWSYLNLIFSLMKYVSFLVLVIVLIYEINNPSSVFIMVVLYQTYIIVVALMAGNFSISKLSTSVTIIGGALLFDHYLQGQYAYKCIDVAAKILGVMILLNLITMILFPTGMYTDDRLWSENYLFGYKNRHIYMFLPYLSLKLAQQYIKKSRIGLEFYVMVGVIIVSAVLCKSTTTLVAIVIYTTMTLIFRQKKNLRKISIWKTYIVSVVVSALIIVFGFQKYFASFLGDVLGKDTSMSARTLIWTSALSSFYKSPIFGNGLISYNNIFSLWTVSQMHNMYLDILVVGGVCLFIIFSVMIFQVSRKHQQIELNAIYNMILFVFVAFFILFITEGKRDLISFIVCVMIAYYMPDLSKRYNIKEAGSRIRIKCG